MPTARVKINSIRYSRIEGFFTERNPKSYKPIFPAKFGPMIQFQRKELRFTLL